MTRKTDKSHSRAPGMTQISISLPKRLVKKVDRLADKENRSRSNYIAYILDQLEDEHGEGADEGIVFLEAAEPESAFDSE